MYCNQCPEVLSGKGCTKNGPCKKHRDELSRTQSQGKKDGVSFSARLKNMMVFFKNKVEKH